MNSLYFFLLTLLYLIAIPFLLFLSLKQKYKKSIPARFFLINNAPFREKCIWFHACSLGETKALKPLIEKYEKVNITVTTQTGYEEAQKYPNADVRYLPFEIFLPLWMRECQTLVVMEAELWLMLFKTAKKRGCHTILINARISDRSFPKYQKLSFFYRHFFLYVDRILAQSNKDKQRLELLGAKEIFVEGNIKTSHDFHVTKEYKKPERGVVTAASTHENEEELVLEAYYKASKKEVLLLVPRHPERFENVYKLIESFSHKYGYRYGRLDEGFDNDIILVDKMGELINLYSISDTVILCGSFEKIGGHNPIEPVYYNVRLISGKEIFNSKALYEMVENIVFCDKNTLAKILKESDKIKPSQLIKKSDISEVLKKINEI